MDQTSASGAHAQSKKNLTRLEQTLLENQPSALIVLQYDNALSCIKSAIRAIDRNDIEARCHCINAAIEVIADLYLWLDHERGGDLAANLGTIYSYMIWKLPEVNFKNDRMLAQEMLRLLKQLRSSWVKVDRQVADAMVRLQASVDLESLETIEKPVKKVSAHVA